MSKAIRFTDSIPASNVTSNKSDSLPLDPNVLFSGIGLLVFLVAILSGVQGVWY